MAQSQIQAMLQILTDHTTQMQNMGRIVSDLQAALTRAQREILTANQKIDYLHNDSTAKAAEILQMKRDGSGGGDGGRGGEKSLGSLVNLKTMEPKVFSGKQGEHFKTWAKKVRSYANGHRWGFKKFLQWVEKQQEPINQDQMDIDWPHKKAASETFYDVLMIHTADDAQVCIELVEDNGAEAWRQLCRRYDLIGESYVLD